MSQFDAPNLASTAWAFAKTGQFDALLFLALASAAKLKMSQFNAQNLANTV